MRIIRNVLLSLCLFAAGTFFGIWADWSEWLAVPAGMTIRAAVDPSITPSTFGRSLDYEVQDYGTANLVVFLGDQISLSQANGVKGTTMNFLGSYAPCAEGNGTAKCTIDGSKPNGPYYFSCNPSKGYSCPDPGIQQSPTQGPSHPIDAANPPLSKAVAKDFEHFFGGKTYFEEHIPLPPAGAAGSVGSATVSPSGLTGNAAVTVAEPIGAYVVCNSSQKTEVDQLNANDPPPDTQITAKKGQLISWVSPANFTLSWIDSGLCTVDKPGSSAATKAQCTVAASPGKYRYTATSTISGCAAGKSATETVDVTK